MSGEEKVSKTLSLRRELLEELKQLIYAKYKVFIKGMLSMEVNKALEEYIAREKERLGLA